MNDRVLDFIQSGDFRPPPTVTEQVLGNLPQAIATLHHIARVGGLYGILSVLPTREPRQRYSTRPVSYTHLDVYKRQGFVR